MKQILIVLCIISIIIPCIVYGVAGFKALSMGSNCIEYLSLAADANNTVMAERHLTSAINYLEAHNLTSGNTNILINHPTNDLGIWYDNLKAAQIQLQEINAKEDVTELEESNVLMKLRETLLSSEGNVTHPEHISFYPNHVAWFWWMVTIWLLWVLAFIFGGVACDEY